MSSNSQLLFPTVSTTNTIEKATYKTYYNSNIEKPRTIYNKKGNVIEETKY